MLTKSAASELSERLWADYQAFASRDLSEFKGLYLFADGIAGKLHFGQPREAVLAASGITETGHKALLGLAPGTKENPASCRDFLRDPKARGLIGPILRAPTAPRAWFERSRKCSPGRCASAVSCTRSATSR
ncbi:MAG: transposase [Burkholderiales bacterium]